MTKNAYFLLLKHPKQLLLVTFCDTAAKIAVYLFGTTLYIVCLVRLSEELNKEINLENFFQNKLSPLYLFLLNLNELH